MSTSEEDDLMASWMELVSGPYYLFPDGAINCTLHHPSLGALPFTARSNDPMQHGRLIHRGILEGGFILTDADYED